MTKLQAHRILRRRGAGEFTFLNLNTNYTTINAGTFDAGAAWATALAAASGQLDDLDASLAEADLEARLIELACGVESLARSGKVYWRPIERDAFDLLIIAGCHKSMHVAP